MATKPELRRILRARRASLADREGRSVAVQHALLAWEPCRLAERLLVYVGVGTEVDTAVLRREKVCAMPVVIDDVLRFRTGELQPGYRGILEPTGESTEPRTGDVLVVPVLGFDSEMSRIGQGKGHYDALIARLRAEGLAIPVVGLAFLVQQVDRLPVEPHDQRLDAIATEAGVWEY